MLEMLQFIQPENIKKCSEFVIVLLVEIYFKREEKSFYYFPKVFLAEFPDNSSQLPLIRPSHKWPHATVHSFLLTSGMLRTLTENLSHILFHFSCKVLWLVFCLPGGGGIISSCCSFSTKINYSPPASTELYKMFQNLISTDHYELVIDILCATQIGGGWQEFSFCQQS